MILRDYIEGKLKRGELRNWVLFVWHVAVKIDGEPT
jgi:hypothetical protein